MANYQEERVKLTNIQLKNENLQQKKKTGIILRINKKSFQDEELQHELFLTTRHTTKIRNAFADNIKLSKAQIFKIIQSGGSFGSWLDNLGKKVITSCNFFS